MAKSTRTFPELVNIKDRATQETLKQNWQKTYDQADLIAALTSRIAALESAVSDLESAVAALQRDTSQAIITSGNPT